MGSRTRKIVIVLVKEMWEWCIARHIWISTSHIPGSNNFVTNELSTTTHQVKPDIDLFASRINHQFPTYVAYPPYPWAVAIDAFSITRSHLVFISFPRLV